MRMSNSQKTSKKLEQSVPTCGVCFSLICYFIIFLLLSSEAYTATIKGVIKDSRNNLLSAVTVIVKQTGFASVTGLNGKFNVTVPDDWDTAVLLFERDGYHPREVRVKVEEKEREFRLFFIPQEYLLEKVTVTAMSQQKKSVDVPVAESSMTNLEIQEKMPENIVESLSDTPGVHFIGSGGLSITPSIRGLARRRVLVLVDGSRITSDRRAGTSPSFIPPEMSQRIEVVRSSSSVYYGSDAVGGVVNIITRPDFDLPGTVMNKNVALNLNYNTNSNRIHTGFNTLQKVGKLNLYAGFQYSHSENFDSPDNEILHSGYSYYAGIVDISRKNDKREFYLGYIGGIGKDIGKPDRSNDPYRYTIVPTEGSHFIRFGYSDKQIIKNGSWNLSLFLNPTTYHLEKRKEDISTVDGAKTTALNLGLKTGIRKYYSESLSLFAGIEWFSRQNVEMDNRLISDGASDITYPLKDGIRNDFALFLTLDYALTKTLHMDGGFRYTFFSISGDVSGEEMEKNANAPSLFLGITQKLNSSMSIFLNVGRAFRFPSLSESFYTGLTGRKYVIGNPNLKSESSWNIDAGLKVAGKKISLGFYVFANFIDNMIERYKDDDGIYTHDNIDTGKIYGGELEILYHPTHYLEFFGNYCYYKGKSDNTDDPLNDIPASRILLGGKFFVDRIWFQADFLHTFAKTDPGPAEVENEVFNLLDLKGGLYLSAAFSLYLKVSNLFNESYYPNADPDIPIARGINFSTGIHFYF